MALYVVLIWPHTSAAPHHAIHAHAAMIAYSAAVCNGRMV